MSKVIWITGLSGSGKTTLATLVTDSIKQSGSPVIMLDGDILRAVSYTHLTLPTTRCV